MNKFLSISLLLLQMFALGFMAADLMFNKGWFMGSCTTVICVSALTRVLITRGRGQLYTAEEVDKIKEEYGALKDPETAPSSPTFKPYDTGSK